MFDPWQQARLNTGLQKINNQQLSEKQTTVDDIKQLAGVNTTPTAFPVSTVNKAQIQREQNIRPGTDAWFKLWFGNAR
jgi:hypothetical protein